MTNDAVVTSSDNSYMLPAFVNDQLARRGWEIGDLCRASSLSYVTIQVLTDGRRVCHKLSTLFCLAYAFDVAPKVIFEAAGVPLVEDDPPVTVDETILSQSETMAEFLKLELKRRGWTATTLHKRAGLSEGVVSMVLNGIRVPSLPTIIAIAGALQVPPKILFPLAKPPVAIPLPFDEDSYNNAKDLRSYLKSEMERRNWSISLFADRARLSVGGLSMVINGVRNPSKDTLSCLALALGYPEKILFDKAVARVYPSKNYLGDNLSALGQFLLEELNAKGKNLRLLAAYMGVRTSSAARYLYGSPPSLRYIVMIAKFLDVPIEVLCRKALDLDDNFFTNAGSEFSLRCYRQIRSLPQEKQDEIFAYVDDVWRSVNDRDA